MAEHVKLARANKAIRFIESLRHTKDPWAGVPFKLESWQKRHIKQIFGRLNSDDTRQVRTVYWEQPRKNGKSELAAAVALYMLYADGEFGAEIYSAAGDRDQATIVFDVAAQMVRMTPALEKRSRIIDSTKRILYPAKNSIYRVLSAEHATKHGFNASAVIFDELHAQPNRKLWDVLTTSGGTREQPLIFAITTAGYDRHSICWEQHEYAEKIRHGVVEDESFYGVIYGAGEKEDWTSEKVWLKANPAMRGKKPFRDIREMRALFRKAREIPALQNTFRRLYLNQWTKQESRWMDLHKWDASAGEVHTEDLLGEGCCAGLDLSSSIDITAFVMVFPDGDGCYDVWPIFWLPEDAMQERIDRDRVPYDIWAQQGYITLTPGNVIDYRYVRAQIKELGEQYHIKEIAFDRWGATEITQYLADDGFEVIEFGQGMASMNAPTKELMKVVIGRRLRHGGNPVLRWMCDNLVVKQDEAGNLKPDKKRSTEKIDGMVALIMGLDRAVRNQTSVYDDRGVLTL